MSPLAFVAKDYENSALMEFHVFWPEEEKPESRRAPLSPTSLDLKRRIEIRDGWVVKQPAFKVVWPESESSEEPKEEKDK